MLIDESGKSLGVVSKEQAFFLAQDAGLDVVTVSASAKTPVVRLMDFNKHRYEEEKRARKARAAQRTGELKEIKLSFRIDEHDFQTKLRKARSFLERGQRIKVFMRLIGRENAFLSQAQEKIQRFAAELDRAIETTDRQGGRLTAILK